MKLAILGDGAWGTAIAILLSQQADHRVVLWSAREEASQRLRERRENVPYLPGVPLPASIQCTSHTNEAVQDADLWIFAIPTVYLRATLAPIASAFGSGTACLSLAKGIENESFLRPTEILRELIHADRLAALSGPSHAEEVSRGMPTTVVAASEDFELARTIQGLFSTDRFRVYTNFDLIGVELGGALKNVVGIAAGISDGLGLGDNAKAALLTRGVVEMARFGVALGAQHETFFGLAGIGDLITTCISQHGRNRQVGLRLGRGEKLAAIRASMKQVAEGIYTARSVHERALKMGIEMPITTEVYRVLYEDKEPRQAVQDLMGRGPRSELRHARS